MIGGARLAGQRRFAAAEGLRADFQPLNAEYQLPGPRRSHRRGGVEGTQRFDLLAVAGPLFAREKIRRHDVITFEGHLHDRPRDLRRHELKFLVLAIVLRSESQRAIEVNQFRADAVADPVGRRAAVEGEPRHGRRRGDRGRGRRRSADRVVFDANTAGNSDPPSAQNFKVGVVKGTDDNTGVEVFVVIGVDAAVVGVAIGSGDRIIEPAAEQLFAVDHGPFVPLRAELIHHRAPPWSARNGPGSGLRS